jgi:hypothetical protein
MANLKLKNPAGGSLNLVSADGASDLTLTFPATTGTAMVSGNMPAFSAYSSSSLSVSSATWTKLQINTEEYDTASCFNTSNYRFTPNVAGYYHFTGQYDIATGSPTRAIIAIRKNDDTTRANGNDIGPGSGNLSQGAGMVVSKIWYMNGSTDYVELFCFLTGGATVDLNAYFQGLMVRAA